MLQYISESDNMHFGIITSKAEIKGKASISIAMQFCGENIVEFLIDRCTADDVIFEAIDNRIVGFITLKLHKASKVEMALGAVTLTPRPGVYRSLMIGTINWGLSQGVKNIFTSAQPNNFSPQKVWTRSGFELFEAYYTFHKWFS